MKIDIKTAKEISLIKWEGELSQKEYSSILNNKYPGLKLIEHFYCGFCVRHEFSEFPTDVYKCKNCEISKVCGECCEDGSLYDKINNIIEDYNTDGELSEECIYLIKELIEVIKNIPE